MGKITKIELNRHSNEGGENQHRIKKLKPQPRNALRFWILEITIKILNNNLKEWDQHLCSKRS